MKVKRKPRILVTRGSRQFWSKKSNAKFKISITEKKLISYL